MNAINLPIITIDYLLALPTDIYNHLLDVIGHADCIQLASTSNAHAKRIHARYRFCYNNGHLNDYRTINAMERKGIKRLPMEISYYCASNLIQNIKKRYSCRFCLGVVKDRFVTVNTGCVKPNCMWRFAKIPDIPYTNYDLAKKKHRYESVSTNRFSFGGDRNIHSLWKESARRYFRE